MSINITVLTGRLTSDVELKTTQNGVSVCSFSIAVDRKYKQGEEKQADFINIVAWRGTAEFVSKHFSKGSAIGIEGSIQTRKYTDKNGNNRTAFEIVANNVHFIDSKRSQSGGEGNSLPTPENDPLPAFAERLERFQEVQDDGDLPF
ncbi:MAG: single-stranded DNA-binding protein [Clostridia bacterium]|nr:single-stranded DNA-binding protein [Clostridia bacterium]